jgi:hypothetical protein
MLLRVCRSSVRSSHLSQKGLGWVDNGEEEEDLRREEGGEVVGGGVRGEGERKDEEGERGEVVRILANCQEDQTTRPYRRRGSRGGRGQGRGRRVAGQERAQLQEPKEGERPLQGGGQPREPTEGVRPLQGVKGNCLRGVHGFTWRVRGGWFPSPASYQAAPRFGLPRGRGMMKVAAFGGGDL